MVRIEPRIAELVCLANHPVAGRQVAAPRPRSVSGDAARPGAIALAVGARCGRCGRETRQERFPLRCGACGGEGLEIVSGEELRVDSIEVTDEQPVFEEVR